MSNVPLPPLSLSCRIIFTGFKKIFSFRLWVNLFGKFREIAKILKHSCNIQTWRRRKTFFWSSKVCSLTNPPCVPSKIPKEIFLPGKKSGQSKSWPGRKLDETKVNLEENRTNQKLTWKKIGQNKNWPGRKLGKTKIDLEDNWTKQKFTWKKLDKPKINLEENWTKQKFTWKNIGQNKNWPGR